MNFSLIPAPLLLVISLIAGTLLGGVGAYHSKHLAKKQSDHYLRSTVMSFFCAATLFALSGFSLKVSPYTFLLAILFGVITMVQTVLTSRAISIGPWSYTTVIVSASTIPTALSGYFFWDEPLSVFKIIGIVLMMGCFIFSVEKKEGEEKKANLLWLILCLFAAACSAGVGILQKIHQSSPQRDELWLFLVLAFLFSMLFSAVMYGWTRRGERKAAPCASEHDGDGRPTWSRRRYILTLGAVFLLIGTMTAAIHSINLYLAGAMESAVFFPIVNGGSLMLSVLFAFIVFRERLTKRQWVGLILGVTAVLFLCF